MKAVVLISGNGSNLHALIEKITAGYVTIQLSAVISNNKDALGLQRAEIAGIPTHILEHKNFSTRVEYDYALLNLIANYAPNLIILAGFMRVLTPEFIRQYWGCILNIHPSLLPKYPGLHTHARALAANETEHGASVHFVTEKLDGGPVILQAKVPILAADNAETLAARVLHQEHQIYPQVIQWFANKRLQLTEQGAAMDGKVLITPLLWKENI